MNTLASILYLVGCAAIAGCLSKFLYGPLVGRAGVERILSWLVLYFSAFLAGFLFLGYVELAAGWRLVTPVAAAALMMVFLGLCRLVLRNRRMPGKPPGPATLSDATSWSKTGRVVLAAVLLTFGTAAVFVIPGFPRGFEAQAYHLPVGVHIFQSQSLKVWDSCFLHTLPANVGIYHGFLLGFLPEHLVSAAGMVFLAPLALAVYGLGRKTGADATASLLASAGTLSIPIVAFASLNADADLGALAFLAAGVFFAMSRSKHGYVLSGLAAGLAFGFKNLHLVGGFVIFMMILFSCWRESRSDAGVSRSHLFLKPVVLFAAAFFGVAGFWLVRNYVQLHNPLYPLSVPFSDYLGWAEAPDIDYSARTGTQFEWVRTPREWLVYPWVEWHYANENFKASSGLGAFFALVPAASFAGLLTLFNRRIQNRRAIGFLLAGGCFVLLCWWLFIRQPRYFAGAFVFLAPLVAWCIHATAGRKRRAFELVTAASIVVMLFVVFSSQLAEFGSRFIYARQYRRNAFYGYPAAIDRLPKGSTIVNFGARTADFALFGKGQRNRIVNYMVSYNAISTDQKDWIPREGVIREAMLRDYGATHLFVVGTPRLKLEGAFSLKELDRMDRDPVINKPLSDPAILYEIKYADGPAEP